MSDERPLSWQSLFAGLTGIDGGSDGPAGRIYREWESWFARQADAARQADPSGQLAAALEAARLARRLLDGAVQAAVSRAGIGDPSPDDGRVAALSARVDALEAQVAALQAEVESMRGARDEAEGG